MRQGKRKSEREEREKEKRKRGKNLHPIRSMDNTSFLCGCQKPEGERKEKEINALRERVWRGYIIIL